MPFKCHENVFYYRDMFNQDVILASLNEIKEMNRNTEFIYWNLYRSFTEHSYILLNRWPILIGKTNTIHGKKL